MRERITFWNRGAKELYGYSAEEALGKVAQELLCTEFPESIERIRKKLVRDHRWSGELVHQCKDGSKVVVMSRWSLDRDERGKPMSVLETNTDITARKKAEAALRRSKQLLELRVRARTHELNRSNKKLKAEISRRKGLEGEILSVSDREQQRLGQELHDWSVPASDRGRIHDALDRVATEKPSGDRRSRYRENRPTGEYEPPSIRAIFPARCTGWMSTQPGSSSRCKIWLTGKFGERPAGWKSNRHFESGR